MHGARVSASISPSIETKVEEEETETENYPFYAFYKQVLLYLKHGRNEIMLVIITKG